MAKEKSRNGWLRNAWYLAAWEDDLAADSLNPLTLLGEPLVLFIGPDGQWCALEDLCCHRLVPLSLGRLEQGAVRCMYHGLKFGCDGRCVEIPGQERVPTAVRVRSYPVARRHGGIWVWAGIPEQADPAAILPVGAGEGEDFVFTRGMVEVASAAELVWDNLLDLTHIPFAHEQSFGGGDPRTIATMLAAETANLHMAANNLGIATARWHCGKPSYAFLGGGLADEFVTSSFLAPGALIIRTQVYPAGTGSGGSSPPPDVAPLATRIACQVVVPVNAERCRIHYHAGVQPAAAGTIGGMADLLARVLEEDRRFIEGQHAAMSRFPDRRPMDLSMDRSGVKFRAIMRRLQSAEAGAPAR